MGAAPPLTPAEEALLTGAGLGLPDDPIPTGQDPVQKTQKKLTSLFATALSPETVARRLRVSVEVVHRRIVERTIYAIKKDGIHWLPRFQFMGDALVPGIGDVLSRLSPSLHPVAVINWLNLPCPDLWIEGLDQGLSPLGWLRSSRDPNRVAEIARHVGEFT